MSGVSHRWPAAIFPSMEAWEAFYNGPTYQGLKSIRDECSSARLVSVLSASAECTDCARVKVTNTTRRKSEARFARKLGRAANGWTDYRDRASSIRKAG